MNRDNEYLIGNKHAVGSKPNSSAFKKGHKPWNKDMKGIHLSIDTEFKKGQIGRNWRPVGDITTRTDKSGNQRRWIKISEPSVWIECSHHTWIANNGKIPKGYVIHHIDMNTSNDDINNLALLTRKAHFEIHGIGEKGRAARKEIAKNNTTI
jgi:hypothetical protein